MRIRVTSTVLDHIGGGDFGQHVLLFGRRDMPTHADDPTQLSLFVKLADAPKRKDGSRVVDLTEDEAYDLLLHAEVMAEGARDNISPWEPWALGEYNAANALVGQLARQGVVR